MAFSKKAAAAALGVFMLTAVAAGQNQAPVDTSALSVEINELRAAIRQMQATLPARTARDDIRQWVAALAPIFGSGVLLCGLLYAGRNYRIAREKHEGDWYAAYRTLYEQFWSDAGMARVRKWIANDESYESELKPVLQKRAEGTHAVDSAGYDLIEVIDCFGSRLALFIQLHPEGLPPSKRELLARTFQYWTGTLEARRPELHSYLMSNWPRVMGDLERLLRAH